jgi:hypothetical protein
VFLKSLWVRVGPQRKPRESVALNPVEQLALRFLLGFGPSTRDSIYTEVNSTRSADASDVDEDQAPRHPGAPQGSARNRQGRSSREAGCWVAQDTQLARGRPVPTNRGQGHGQTWEGGDWRRCTFPLAHYPEQWRPRLAFFSQRSLDQPQLLQSKVG